MQEIEKKGGLLPFYIINQTHSCKMAGNQEFSSGKGEKMRSLKTQKGEMADSKLVPQKKTFSSQPSLEMLLPRLNHTPPNMASAVGWRF